ncbi:hypothetical protein PPE03_34260 [Pseudoalteromonas peptidolytica]|nr:hypothetical protein PPE03_34260 [Pseudoalteromonas peptidolytica]
MRGCFFDAVACAVAAFGVGVIALALRGGVASKAGVGEGGIGRCKAKKTAAIQTMTKSVLIKKNFFINLLC